MPSRPNDSVHITFGFRLALLYAAFMALSLLVLFFVTYQLVSRVAKERDRDVIEAQAAQFKTLYDQAGISGIANYFSQPINPTEHIFVRIVDPRNQMRFITVSHPLWELLDAEMAKNTAQPKGGSRWDELSREETQGSWIVGTLPLGGGYSLQVGRSNAESQLVLAHFRRTGLRILLPATLLSLLGSWLIARGALAPLRALVRTIHNILATGDQQQRVPDHAQRGELGALGTLFNRILDKNEQLIQASKETLDNVAHDLRTPMTHLRNSAERALQQADPDPRLQREALADCMEESERILQMLNLLMDLADARTGGMKLRLEAVSLRELADEVVELYSIVAEDRGIALVNDVPTYATATADRLRLRQCLANLVDNALKYSPEHSEVVLFGRSDDATVAIAVRDRGCGIAAEDQPKIWDRLYRAERSRATPGLGLGLSLVLAIAEAHGGTVEVDSHLGEGSTFTLRLPRIPLATANA